MSNQPKQKTAIRQLIGLLEDTKKTKCKTLQEVVFFDGVLALIDASGYEALNEKQIKDACNGQDIIYREMDGHEYPYLRYTGQEYFDETFEKNVT